MIFPFLPNGIGYKAGHVPLGYGNKRVDTGSGFSTVTRVRVWKQYFFVFIYIALLVMCVLGLLKTLCISIAQNYTFSNYGGFGRVWNKRGNSCLFKASKSGCFVFLRPLRISRTLRLHPYQPDYTRCLKIIEYNFLPAPISNCVVERLSSPVDIVASTSTPITGPVKGTSSCLSAGALRSKAALCAPFT